MSATVPNMNVILDSIEATIDSAVRSWVLTVTAERDRLIAQGMSEQAVTNLLLTSIEGLTGPFSGAAQSIGRVAAQAANAAQHNAYLNGIAQSLGGEGLADVPMEWLRDPSADSCDDCIAREGEVMLYSEWQEIGVPGAGGTQCGANCRCTLIPAGNNNG